MNRARALLALSAAALLAGCEAEEMLRQRLQSAQSLSPQASAALLFGGTFLSEDLSCVSAGVLVSRGSIDFWLAALACTVGVWISDSLLYAWGVLGRRGLLEKPPLRWLVKRDKVERGSILFQRHGAKMIVLSRFLPGSRLPLYVAAGMLRYPYRRFAAWMALAALLWAPALVWFSMKLGNTMLGWIDAYEEAAWIAFPLVVLAIWGITRALEWFIARRGAPLREAAALEKADGESR